MAVHARGRFITGTSAIRSINGFYQGWDLHPAQLPIAFRGGLFVLSGRTDAASERLRNFIAKAAQATQVGGVFDDAATGQGLLNYFLRADQLRRDSPKPKRPRSPA